MNSPDVRFYFDFADPLSYLVEREVRTAEATSGVAVVRVPFELRPPPAPLTDTEDPVWGDRWSRARELAGESGAPFAPPSLVPWSRKAHELHLLARSRGLGSAAAMKIFDAFFVEGRDIGRVDVLVAIGRGLGLDLTETKAVLDVDRYEEDVMAARASGAAEGVREPPVIVAVHMRLEGFHNRAALRTFLARSCLAET